MALNIPTTEEIKDRNVSNIESRINQTSPATDKSFNRVLAAMEALNHTELYKFAVERALQNFALTATGEDLERIGAEFAVTRKPAEAATVTVQVPGTNGSILPVTLKYVGNLNGLTYSQFNQAIAAGGYATVDITCDTLGVSGNLNIGDTLSLNTQVAGFENTATVTSVINIGAAEEDTESYRERVLFAERAVTGGGNVTDYKIWAEEVAGIERVYPFAGKPFDMLALSYPGERTVYVEATTNIDPDGIAPQSLLDEVRAVINNNPDTGESRPPLGIVDTSLYVESIVRTSFYVSIENLTASPDIEAQLKTDIENALESYFLSIRPYVEGVDLPQARNDFVTEPSVSEIVQDILAVNGASAYQVQFGLTPGVFLPIKTLNPNELAKLGGVSYV